MSDAQENGVKRWYVKAQGNQLETPVYCQLSEDDCIDISQPGEDRWIATIIQTVDPTNNPRSMTSKWVCMVLASDHDRVVAHLEVSYQNQIGKLNETIAAQSLVIEKLKEQRDDLAHDAAYEINYGPHPKEALEKIKELDAELAALTKQPEPKEGV